MEKREKICDMPQNRIGPFNPANVNLLTADGASLISGWRLVPTTNPGIFPQIFRGKSSRGFSLFPGARKRCRKLVRGCDTRMCEIEIKRSKISSLKWNKTFSSFFRAVEKLLAVGRVDRISLVRSETNYGANVFDSKTNKGIFFLLIWWLLVLENGVVLI